MDRSTAHSQPTASIAGRFVLAAGGLFSLLAVAALLYLFPQLKHSLFWQAWMDFAHFPVFVLWQLLLGALLGHWGQRWPRLRSAVILVVLAALVEVVQGWFGRSTSLHDWVTGSVGVGVGWLLGNGFARGKAALGAALIVLLTALVCAAYPAVQLTRNLWQDSQQMPRLLELSGPKIPPFWTPLPTDSIATASLSVAPCDAIWCLVVTTQPRVHSGVSRYIERGNWHHYQTLVLVLQSADALTLHIRIDDRRPSPTFDQRYNQEWDFPGGQQFLRIPLQGEQGVGRYVDVTQVRRLALFVGPQPQPMSFRILQAYLE